MKTTATIASVKTAHQPATYNGPARTTLTIALDIALPTPVTPMDINDWARHLPYNEQQAIRKAQEGRAAAATGRKPLNLTKKQKQAQEDAHANGEQCAWTTTCEDCNPVIGIPDTPDTPACLAHQEPACEQCEAANAPFLDGPTQANLQARYGLYVTDVQTVNRQAVQAAQEAALFLLLIKQDVRVTVEPMQGAMTDLLLLEGRESQATP